MIENFVPLLASYFSPDMLEMWVYPFFFLCFIGAVPGLIRLFTEWR